MKKIFPIFPLALLLVIVSCGGSSNREQIIADSIAAADSIASARYDSMAAVANELFEAQRNLELASIINDPIKIGNLLVARNDFPNNMEWSDAQRACVSLGPGWRLPTIDELKILHQNSKIIGITTVGVMCCKWYWSSTPFDEKRMEFLQLGNGFWGAENKVRSYAVRAVRDF
jgi:hypothetical protein